MRRGGLLLLVQYYEVSRTAWVERKFTAESDGGRCACCTRLASPRGTEFGRDGRDGKAIVLISIELRGQRNGARVRRGRENNYVSSGRGAPAALASPGLERVWAGWATVSISVYISKRGGGTPRTHQLIVVETHLAKEKNHGDHRSHFFAEQTCRGANSVRREGSVEKSTRARSASRRAAAHCTLQLVSSYYFFGSFEVFPVGVLKVWKMPIQKGNGKRVTVA